MVHSCKISAGEEEAGLQGHPRLHREQSDAGLATREDPALATKTESEQQGWRDGSVVEGTD